MYDLKKKYENDVKEKLYANELDALSKRKILMEKKDRSLWEAR